MKRILSSFARVSAAIVLTAFVAGAQDFGPDDKQGAQGPRQQRPPSGQGEPQGGFDPGRRGPGFGPGPNLGGGSQQRGAFRRTERMGDEAWGAPRPSMIEPRVVVMNLGRLDEATSHQMDADLNVMLTILERSVDDVNGQRPVSALGIPVSLQSRFGRHTAVFLEDYGVLFRILVAYPLSPATGLDNSGKGREKGSVWEQTRRELYQQPGAPPDWDVEISYDAARVSELKHSIMNALKQSVNIRGLKPEDHITVAVTSVLGRRLPDARKEQPPGESTGRPDIQPRMERGFPADQMGTDSLIISATQSDIMAVAAGKLTDVEFEKHIKVGASWETPQKQP